MMTPEEQAYVRKLEETIVKLEARIAELERRLNMNSSNSSKPPSTDKPNQKKRSLRKPSGKKPGGQSGHKGTTLKLPCAPSKIIPCNPKECAGCALAGQCQGKCLESRYFMSVLKLPVSTGFIHNAVKKYAGKLDDAISSKKKRMGFAAPIYCGNCKVL